MEGIIPQHDDVMFYKIDIDKMDRSLLNEYNIRSVPKLLMFVDGYDVGEILGSKSAIEVTEFINSHKVSWWKHIIT